MTSFSETAVPERSFISLKGVPRDTLRLMRKELRGELRSVAKLFREEAANRNGLAAVLVECERRSIV